MADEKVKAAQRALELWDKMCRWEGEVIIKKIVSINNDNPYLPEFNVCMAIVNS